MRVTFLASAALSAVSAFDLTYFSDDKCATPTMEMKGVAQGGGSSSGGSSSGGGSSGGSSSSSGSSGGSAATSPPATGSTGGTCAAGEQPCLVAGNNLGCFPASSCTQAGGTPGRMLQSSETTIKWSTQAIVGGVPNECVTLGEDFEITPEQGDKIKLAFTRVGHCDEYGSFSIAMYSKEYKECKPIKEPSGDETATILTGYASTCQPFGFAGQADGASTLFGMTFADKDGKKTVGSYKANCNPKPADVAGIVLGTLSVVFAFASIGLAAAAKGK